MKIGDYISQIYLEDRYVSKLHETTTLYFVAPADLLDGKYPDAEFATISVEYPNAYPEASYASVMVSPSKYLEDCDAITDYDWFDVDLSYEEIELLLNNTKEV